MPAQPYDLDAELARAAEVLRSAHRVTVLTGAGVSAESGVPTFRASDGLWEGHRIEDVATPTGFRKDPELVWRFYNGRRVNVSQVQPNPGHHALVALEDRYGSGFALATQNVDGLHQQAGSKTVFEVHGSLRRTRCTDCERVEDRGLTDLGNRPICAHCGGFLRPDIVWFHEPLPEDTWMSAMRAAQGCEVLLVVGTSAVVYPAAELIPIARRGKSPGATVIECNLDRTAATTQADIGLYGPSGETLPRLVELLR
ncbi:MAG: NAD-dependent deacylase [Fimbriiglobus sp.]|jgi:NAD-dependent deacetylase|nr:NAD-dependent deacylase [Fimbriiglobus sp.]